MAYIRVNEDRKYFRGESGLYVYPTNPGMVSITAPGVVEDEDLAELALRVVEKADVDEETFAEVVEAVGHKYTNE